MNRKAVVPLIPPPDVAWLWHAHRLAPQRYVAYCQATFEGTVLEAVVPFAFQQSNNDTNSDTDDSDANDEQIIRFDNRRASWVTRLLWRREFPDEPFFFLGDRQAKPAVEQSPQTTVISSLLAEKISAFEK